jgi:hypothetical protein
MPRFTSANRVHRVNRFATRKTKLQLPISLSASVMARAVQTPVLLRAPLNVEASQKVLSIREY